MTQRMNNIKNALWIMLVTVLMLGTYRVCDYVYHYHKQMPPGYTLMCDRKGHFRYKNVTLEVTEHWSRQAAINAAWHEYNMMRSLDPWLAEFQKTKQEYAPCGEPTK